METLNEWAERAEAWLQRDHALLTEPDGWRSLAASGDFELWSRRMPDDANNLYRWRLPVVDAPADVVFEGFVHRILTYHKAWTREFVSGRVVETPGPNARVVYQRFEPGIPGIAPRDLCSLEVLRDPSPGVKLVSFRSVDRLPRELGCARIDWWGAALCRTLEGGERSEFTYLDRENQGGSLPAWFVNLTMPGYLTKQARAVRRFFAGGGPPELRSPRAE